MSALLTTFGIDWHLLLAQGVNFLVLAALLTWLLYKPVLGIVRKRAETIAQGVEDAERAAEKLAGADDEAALRIQRAEGEAEGIVKTARESANTERARLMKEAEARAATVAADADARAKETAARSLRESEKEIARLAVLAAEKVLRKEP